MPHINKVTVVGHLGRDVEMRYMPSGDPIANFSVAVTDRYKDKSGEMQEKTEWVSCVVFGPLAELVGQQFSKGSAIHVDGKLQTRKWQDKAGNDRYTTEVVANYVASPVYAKKEVAKQSTEKPRVKDSNFDDDIPF